MPITPAHLVFVTLATTGLITHAQPAPQVPTSQVLVLRHLVLVVLRVLFPAQVLLLAPAVLAVLTLSATTSVGPALVLPARYSK